ncbi:peptidylprolyl isomerase [Actibacterium sp. MT2.3-13A]|uniref:peptidylprolyl isomerase n=1 Tax=Actibacterium sp. MT2.3-13A TaxID=2828332 RepID=UPI001BAAD23F|nr:peptidylprolyl isomerase [Actibacterium sp. MT2.3-13A]
MTSTVKKTGNIVVWILLLLLIVGLAGFGVGNFGGSVNAVGKVGDEEITVDDYARELQRALREQSAAQGRSITLAEAQATGVVAQVRASVVAAAAMDNEAGRMGLSVGDAAVRDQLLAIPAFQGVDGKFDREAYRFALEQNRLTEAEFEAQIREETARSLLQGSVVAGLRAPQAYADTLYDFIAARRSFTFARLDAAALDAPVPAPSTEQARAYYEANEPAFTAPESKRITYAWLTPDMLIDTVEVNEQMLRDLYEERLSDYVIPERRLVERLVFGTMEEAEAAAARLEAGEVTFDALVEERGLSLDDIDMGDVSAADLGAAGAPVFALQEPGVTGPHMSDLGPALFRMNAVLAAQETPFEAARDELRAELAQDRARRIIADDVTDIDDRLAAGATVEDLAKETGMELGEITYYPGLQDGIAAYDAFREAAAALQEGDFPEVIELEDGGIFAMRLDEVTAPRLRPFEEVSDAVTAGWQAEETRRLLAEKATALKALLDAGDAFETLGLTVETAEGLTRGAVTPVALAKRLFALEEVGQTAVVEDASGVYLARLDAILPPDDADPATTFLRQTLEGQAAQSLSQDIYAYFAESLVSGAGLTLDQTAMNAVHAQFP